MKPKQATLAKDLERLLKDLERLLAKYTANWKLLETGTTIPKVSKLKKRRSKKAASASRIANKAAKKRPKETVTKHPTKGRNLTRTRGEDLAHRSVLSRASTGDLYGLYLHAYKGRPIPKSRGVLTAELDKHLRKVSEPERARILHSLPSLRMEEPSDEFNRWVDIISKPDRR